MGKLGSTDTKLVLFYAWFNFPDWIRVFSEFRNLERAWLWLSKINSNTIGTMQKTTITVNYLQNAVSSGGAFFFLRGVALVVGVLFSLKSCFSCWGTVFFEEFTLFGGVLACLLSSKSCSACCVICFWLLGRFALLVGLLGLWGCLACW